MRGEIPCTLKDTQCLVRRVTIDNRPEPRSLELDVRRTIRLLASQCMGASFATHVVPSSSVPCSGSSSTSTAITVRRNGVRRGILSVVGRGRARGWVAGEGKFVIVVVLSSTVGGTFQSKVRNMVVGGRVGC